MNSVDEEYVDWNPAMLLEISFKDDDDFLKIKETLTRIGIPVFRDGEQILYQSCHILHKKGRYYIVHFKELFALDGKPTTITQGDIDRKFSVAKLIEDWGLCSVIGRVPEDFTRQKIKVIKHSEKNAWKLEPKYNIGTK